MTITMIFYTVHFAPQVHEYRKCVFYNGCQTDREITVKYPVEELRQVTEIPQVKNDIFVLNYLTKNKHSMVILNMFSLKTNCSS